GPRSRHGVIWDFVNKLLRNPRRLEILGDGTQRKSYLYVSDAIEATIHLAKLLDRVESYDVFNVGNRDWVTVREIADIVVEEMGLSSVEYVFKPATPDGRGWPGDVKLMLLSIDKIVSTGWSPSMSSAEAVRATARAMLEDLGYARGC
ncbi:MAG: NAD-dependent epimerase/dehydratase family protein, partial [Crenarchaeota archaeon]|nr:NAD-dependent epimerase/dehydratase family protein [Thermoproteota archaeon]